MQVRRDYFSSEEEALDALVDRFAAEMKLRLRQKRLLGKSGWDDPSTSNTSELHQKACEHCIARNFVDAANYLALLWNHDQPADP